MKKLAIAIFPVICLLLIATACTNGNAGLIPPPVLDSTPYDVETSEGFVEMLSSTGKVRLTDDLLIEDAVEFEDGKEYEIDLNDNILVLSLPKVIQLNNNAVLKIADGTIYSEDTSIASDDPSYTVRSNLAVNSGSKLILDNVSYNTPQTAIGLYYPNASVEIYDSEISTGAYGVSTNADDSYDSENVSILIDNSTITSTIQDSCGVLLNVPGNLVISNSSITAGRQAVIVRSGTATITNSTLASNGSYSEVSNPNYHLDEASLWGSGNEVPMAALVVGDKHDISYYKADAVCTVSSSQITMADNENDTNRFLIYLSSDPGTATLEDEKQYTNAILNIDNEEDCNTIKSEKAFREGNGTTVTVNLNGSKFDLSTT